MSVEQMEDCMGALPRKPRYINAAPRTILELARLVVDELQGDAALLWKGRAAADVREILMRVHGVGEGIANMTLLLIERVFQVRFGDIERATMDIKPDIHAVRVLHRLGVSRSPDVASAIEAARLLDESCPGAMDPALWIVGRDWCHKSSPNCASCPLSSICEMQGIPQPH